MANMSYCRFQNTVSDLRDCVEHLEDDDLSKDEQRARESLIDLCHRVVAQFPEGGGMMRTYSLLHEHRYGIDTYMVRSNIEITREQLPALAKILDIDFEPEKHESLVLDDVNVEKILEITEDMLATATAELAKAEAEKEG